MITLKRYLQEIKKPTINPLTSNFIYSIMVLSRKVNIRSASSGQGVKGSLSTHLGGKEYSGARVSWAKGLLNKSRSLYYCL